MGIWGAVENAAGDVMHAGEDVARKVAAVENFIADAGLGNIAQELEQLANRANQLRQQLTSAASSTRWSGAAARAFEQRAHQRQSQIAALVSALDSAHATVGAAYVSAGIL